MEKKYNSAMTSQGLSDQQVGGCTNLCLQQLGNNNTKLLQLW